MMQITTISTLEAYEPEKGIPDILQARWKRSDSRQEWQVTANLLSGMTCILDLGELFWELAFLESIAHQRALMAITGGMSHAK